MLNINSDVRPSSFPIESSVNLGAGTHDKSKKKEEIPASFDLQKSHALNRKQSINIQNKIKSIANKLHVPNSENYEAYNINPNREFYSNELHGFQNQSMSGAFSRVTSRYGNDEVNKSAAMNESNIAIERKESVQSPKSGTTAAKYNNSYLRSTCASANPCKGTPSVHTGTDYSDVKVKTPYVIKNTDKFQSNKFMSITEKLQSVEKIVDERANIQLRNEANRLQIYKEKIQELEQLLVKLSKDRIEAHKTISAEYESKVCNLRDHFENFIEKKNTEFVHMLSSLEYQFNNLNGRINVLENDNTVHELNFEITTCKQSIEELKSNVPEMLQETSKVFAMKVQELENMMYSHLETETVSSSSEKSFCSKD